MYLLFSLIFALMGTFLSVDDISNTPFAQLTLKMIFESLFSMGFYCGAIYFLLESLSNDRIWPWRWTFAYFGNLCIRLACSILVTWIAVFQIKEHNIEGWWYWLVLGILTCMLLHICFSSDYESFKEKNTSK